MLGTFPGIFPTTSIDLLLVAVIVNLTKVMISHAKHLQCKKMQPSKVESYVPGREYMKRSATTRSDIKI